MSGLEYLAGVVRKISERVETIPSFRWARITSKRPLRVKIDGPADEPEVAVSALFGADTVGDRVLAIMSGRRIFAFNPSNKPPEDIFPTGAIMEYAGTEAPSGWLLCNGQQVLVSDYPKLYSVIGTRYGGSGTVFALPDHRGRVGVGLNPTNSDFNYLGKVGGEARHTLTVSEMPSHSHGMKGGWGAGSRGVGFFRADGNNPRTLWSDTYPQGGSQPHNNLQPYVVINFIIKT